MKSKNQLKNNEELFKSIYENTTIGLYRTTPDGKILLANPALIKMLGFSCFEDLAKRNLEEDGFELDNSRREFIERLEKDEEVIGMESIWKRNDGVSIFVRESAKRISDSNNNAVFYEGTVEDITERKKAEKALAETEQRFRQVVEEAKELIFTCDLNGYYTYVNSAGLKLSGYSFDELKNMRYSDLITPDYKRRVRMNYLRQYINRSENTYTEYPFYTKSGSTIWLGQNARLLFENNKVCGFYVISRDITERKLSEEKLRENEKRYRDLIEKMLDGVYKSTHAGKFLEINDALVKMLGYANKEELYEIDIKSQLYFQETDRESAALEEKLEEMSVFRLKKKDGSEIWVEDHGRHILDDQGNVQYHEGVMRDVSERIQTELQLKKYSEELKLANETKDKFFSIIAHDLRSPFNVSLGLSGILAADLDSLSKDELKIIVDGLHTSLQKQYELLTDLLDWARLQNKNFVLKNETVFLQKELNRVIEAFTLTAKQKEIELINNVEDDLSVFADVNMLKLVLRNLISNSIKFTNRDGVITISALKKDSFIEVTVSDTGIGIDEKDMQELFLNDVRYTTEGTEKEKGTGLGLLLCKEIIEKHHGKIWVKSEIGKGSKFIFTLPVTA